MREIVQNELTYFEVGVTDASGKLRTGLVVDYEIHKCSDNSLLVSGTANEIGITGVYSFSYTFTDIEEYRLHWITPLTYDDGFELLNVVVPGITIADIGTALTSYDSAKQATVKQDITNSQDIIINEINKVATPVVVPQEKQRPYNW
jgi:hypothetical protein